jgi:hypothetical protein
MAWRRARRGRRHDERGGLKVPLEVHRRILASLPPPVAPEWQRARTAPWPRKQRMITDNRTGKSHELPVEDGTIKALSPPIKVDENDFGPRL